MTPAKLMGICPLHSHVWGVKIPILIIRANISVVPKNVIKGCFLNGWEQMKGNMALGTVGGSLRPPETHRSLHEEQTGRQGGGQVDLAASVESQANSYPEASRPPLDPLIWVNEISLLSSQLEKCSPFFAVENSSLRWKFPSCCFQVLSDLLGVHGSLWYYCIRLLKVAQMPVVLYSHRTLLCRSHTVF